MIHYTLAKQPNKYRNSQRSKIDPKNRSDTVGEIIDQVMSLVDLLRPLPVVLKRVRARGWRGFVICQTLVELKYMSSVRKEQYERQQMMGETLAERLGKTFYVGMVVERKRDLRYIQVNVPYVTWAEVMARLV